MKSTRISIVALTIAFAPQALAHEIPWPLGMSRSTASNACSKPLCHRRASFASSVPHDHVSNGMCVGKGAAG